jgi:hypothetical protein
MKLRLAPDFTLPLEAVTSTFGLEGRGELRASAELFG